MGSMLAPGTLRASHIVPTHSEIRAAIADHEVPTTPEWCSDMKAARKALGLSQEELAAMVGTTQPTISNVESRKIAQSNLVPAIAVALGMRLPHEPTIDNDDANWIRWGRQLRERKRRRYDLILQQIQLDLEEDAPEENPGSGENE